MFQTIVCGNLLFCTENLDAFLAKRREEMRAHVNKFDRVYLLETDEKELIDALRSEYEIMPVRLLENESAHEPPQDDNVNGVSITVTVPFEGHGRLFTLRPASVPSQAARAIIGEGKLCIEFRQAQHDPSALKRAYSDAIGLIREFVNCQKPTIDKFNAQLEGVLGGLVRDRKAKIRKDIALAESLQIPLSRRNPPENYDVPITRRKPVIEMPKGADTGLERSWRLAEEEYQHILGIIHAMALVMERSPRAFLQMREEDIRTLFLVHLNGHYEGAATGETFNFEGKTDILIRWENRNVFIAECKVWKGEKKLLEAIDQLLGYTCWRDTKTAVILFNKGKNFSAVLERIAKTVPSHPNYKRKLPKTSETRFSYVFSHRHDTTRELMLTVLAFDIPTPSRMDQGARPHG